MSKPTLKPITRDDELNAIPDSNPDPSEAPELSIAANANNDTDPEKT